MAIGLQGSFVTASKLTDMEAIKMSTVEARNDDVTGHRA